MKKTHTFTLEGETQTIKDTLDIIESLRAINTGHDEYTLDILVALHLDIITALERDDCGPTLDDTIKQVDPHKSWRKYITMWLDQLDTTDQLVAQASRNDYTSKQAETKIHEALSYRERIAWRYWQCQVRTGNIIEVEDIYKVIDPHVKTRRLERAA